MSGNKKKWILHENVRIRPLLLHLCNLFLMYDAQSAMSLHNGVMFGIQIMDSTLVDAFECMDLVKRHSAYKSRTINLKLQTKHPNLLPLFFSSALFFHDMRGTKSSKTAIYQFYSHRLPSPCTWDPKRKAFGAFLKNCHTSNDFSGSTLCFPSQ